MPRPNAKMRPVIDLLFVAAECRTICERFLFFVFAPYADVIKCVSSKLLNTIAHAL